VFHQTDCCGSFHAWGIAGDESASFDTQEAACRNTYPLCECAMSPTSTDSGETSIAGDDVQVGCISEGPSQVCRTYVEMRPLDTP
jgi:hypothetical protein